MVHFKARQHFQVTNGKIDFSAEAGRKKVCSFISKEKMFLSDQGTDYQEIHWFPYVSKILSSKMGHTYELLKMHAMKMGQLQARFSDLEFVKHMETNVFLGSLFLDLKGTSFLLIGNCILFSYQPQQKNLFSHW